ncbi:antibiotic biosynthesis monooxygenase [Amycolatopsis japonica]|uniref:antibiotic biosynthesis monooxygenase n=1 Tax=Amycolatopsis japonica TaxID=208439 RepID=UPI00366F5E94
MTSVKPGVGFATIETLRIADPGEVRTFADLLAHEVHACAASARGFVSAQIYVSLDNMAVVRRSHWADQSAYRAFHATGRSRGSLSDFPGVHSFTVFEGAPQVGLEGPAFGETPGIVVVATRHLSGHESARAVLGLLAKSGEWKRRFPGFISATPYVSDDGKTFVNCPMWVDERAFDTWMADPRIAEARHEVVEQEEAPPDVVVCVLDEHIGTGETSHVVEARR